MMEKLRDVLITDRTQADVNRAVYLRSLFNAAGIWTGSKAEKQELEESKGIYTPVDANRVLRACSWLAGKLEGYGYSVPGEYFPAVLINVTVDPPGKGIAAGVVAYLGEECVLMAFDNGSESTEGDPYKFRRWEENGEPVSKDAVYTFTAESDRDLVAVFDTTPPEEFGVVGMGAVGMAIVGKDVT